MTVEERDLYRLSILKKMCEVTDYNISIQIGQGPQVIELFNIQTDDEYNTFIGAITYLTEKHYIESKLIPMANGITTIFMIKLTAYGLDLIEKIERKKSIIQYENDFSSSSIIKLQNISDSNIIINSPNSVITLTNTIDAINSLKDFSSPDKESLVNQITDLSSYNKNNVWEKTKKIFSWLADKSADAAIAVLPYILEQLK